MPAPSRSVRLRRRNGQLASPTDFHAGDAVLPPLDQSAQRELDRLAPVPRAVEFLARVVFDADVVHLDIGAWNGLDAVADDDVLDQQFGRGGAVGELDFWFGSHHVTLLRAQRSMNVRFSWARSSAGSRCASR